MGVAQIISHQGKGLYTIDLLLRTDEIFKQRKYFNELVATLKAEEIFLEDALVQLEDLKEDAKQGLDILIDAPLFPVTGSDIAQGITTPEAKREKALKDLTKEINKLRNLIIETKVALDRNHIKQAPAILNQKLYEAAIFDTIRVDAWCIDYTTNLIEDGGDVFVETVEAMDEYSEPNFYVNIRPLTATTQTLLKDKIDRAGRLTEEGRVDKRGLHKIENVLGSKLWTILYNWMTLPALQKWKPQYKLATVTSIDYLKETCSITFTDNPFESSVLPFPLPLHFPTYQPFDQPYNVQNEPGHDKVPIKYMFCAAEPFVVGDRVVVEYLKRDLKSPTVIGFRASPRRCAAQYLIYKGLGNTAIYRAVPMTNKGQIDLANAINLAGAINGIFSNNTLDSGWTTTGVGVQAKDHLASGYHKTNNVTAAHRLTAGNRIHKDNGVEESDIYTFNNYKVFKNGSELALDVDFEEYRSWTQEEEDVGYNPGNNKGALIVGVDFKFGSLYVTTVVPKIHADPKGQKISVLVAVGPAVPPVADTLDQKDGSGTRVFLFNTNGFEVDAFNIHLGYALFRDLAIPEQQTDNIAKITHDMSQITYDIAIPVYDNPPKFDYVLGYATGPTKFLSYIFSVDISEDFIIFTAIERPYFISGIGTAVTAITVCQRSDGTVLSFRKATISASNDNIGNLYGKEEFTDSMSASGELSVKGALNATEQATDTAQISS